MKTENLILLGVAGLGAYLFLKNKEAPTQPMDTPFYSSPNVNAPVSPSNPLDIKNNSHTTRLTSNQAGVDYITSSLRSRTKINSAGEQLVKPVAIASSVGGGNVMQGTSRLATGQIAQLTVSQPARDAQGLTDWDRRIARNKIAAGII